ncbi:hypothetical protein QR680_014411 [Steinernema hermaphroditum]|uniref:Uncharacterized protein n=1 Tax=Steinernema hermaphroditum TaxID=289476 RepID=A0AA39I8S9_9BILA|nr:hypothetical protein QR680_014411 [Steinernema hermaphroditum]
MLLVVGSFLFLFITPSVSIKCHCSQQDCNGPLQSECDGNHCIIGFQKLLDLPILSCGQERIEVEECFRKNGSYTMVFEGFQFEPERVCRCVTDFCNTVDFMNVRESVENETLVQVEISLDTTINTTVGIVSITKDNIPVWMYILLAFLIVLAGLLTCLSALLSYKLRQALRQIDSVSRSSDAHQKVYVTAASHTSTPYFSRREMPSIQKSHSPVQYPSQLDESFLRL